VAGDVEMLLGKAHHALEEGAWGTARDLFRSSLAELETPEALLGLSEASWWLGETEASVRSGEGAYSGFRRRGDMAKAVLAAVLLYFHYRMSLGNAAAARGWLGRAARLVEEFELAPLEGWVLLLRAHDSGDPAASERCAREARELGRRFGDADLELCALAQLGASLTAMGRVEEGGALLDEAMAASLAGECTDRKTVVYTSCGMISACGEVADVERAAQWIHAADEFTSRYGNPHLYTTCRVYYGAVLFATGEWAEAERELTAALESARKAEKALYVEALGRLAELRLAQGRLDEAERLLVGLEDHSSLACAIGAVRLARGEAAAAEAAVRRRLRELEEHERPGPYPLGAAACLQEATLLELLALAELEQGKEDHVRATLERLGGLAERAGCEPIAARAARMVGAALVIAGDREAAVESLERALSLYARLGLPYEAARTHLLLARAFSAPEAAVREARAALDSFELLGAARDADAAAALLRSLGVKATRSGRRDAGVLSPREREVLELLAEGLSNRELAERLFLSRKTVEHHVRSVLRKLGLRSRAEAAAYAARELERSSSTG
jgi:DNA-binding CsgD family transcriptional regulator/predicted negative regulator of RcsB-dependent stress response